MDADEGRPERTAVLGRTEFSSNVVSSNDFESGLGGFTIDNGPLPGHLAGFWHLSPGRGTQAGHSATQSLYYGQSEGPFGGGTYGIGTRQPAPSPRLRSLCPPWIPAAP